MAPFSHQLISICPFSVAWAALICPDLPWSVVLLSSALSDGKEQQKKQQQQQQQTKETIQSDGAKAQLRIWEVLTELIKWNWT